MSLSVDLDPDTNVVFTGDFCSSTTTKLSIKNLDTENAIIFKIKTNAPQRYVVKPHKGTIGPSDTVTVVMTLLPFHYKVTERYPDKFLIQTCIFSKLNLEYVKHDFWTMVAREELYERKLRCVFDHKQVGNHKRPSMLTCAYSDPQDNCPTKNGSISSMDRLILDSSDNVQLKEKLDQAKEQIRQLIQQGTDLRTKNERLEEEKTCEGSSHTKTETVTNAGKIASSVANGGYMPHIEIQVPRTVMLIAMVVIMWLGILLGKYIM